MKKTLEITLLIFIMITSLCSCSSVADGTVTYEIQKTESRVTAPDGTLVYYGVADYPVIKIQGNKSAAKLINKGIDDAIRPVTNPENDYISEYKSYRSQGLEYVSNASFSCSVISTCTNDEYMSFQVMTYTHEACAMRDIEYISGLTFSAVSGEKTDIYDLSEDDNAMTQLILASIAKAGSGKRDFDSAQAESLIKSGDFSWYMSENDITIIIDPGEATPISEGSVQAQIPLEEIP